MTGVQTCALPIYFGRVGDRVFFGPLELVVKEVDDLSVVQKVGLRIRE